MRAFSILGLLYKTVTMIVIGDIGSGLAFTYEAGSVINGMSAECGSQQVLHSLP